MHHIDIMVSVTGSNLLQGFRESLLPNPLHTTPEEDEDDEDIASIMQRLPADTRPFEDFLTAAQGCLLLLMLKQHLKEQYGLTDAKVSQYSPSEGAKIYDKNAPRKVITIFMPRPTLQALKGTTRFFFQFHYFNIFGLLMNFYFTLNCNRKSGNEWLHGSVEQASAGREVPGIQAADAED
jgi:hypothetical protein